MVVIEMENGKKIRRKSWKEGSWININNLKTLGKESLTAEDWEIVEEDVKEPTVNYFSFSEALEKLKDGKKVTRKGWNGKGMFLVLCPGSDVDVDCMRVKEVKKFYKQEGHTSVEIAPHIDLKAVDDTYVTGWVASQIDILADDWFTVE